MTEPSDDTLKALWKGQQTEQITMSIEALRIRAAAQHDEGRRTRLMRLAAAAGVALMLGGMAFDAQDLTVRLGYLVVLAWVVGVTAMQRRLWPDVLPGEGATAAQLVDFNRSQILKQAQSLRTLAVTSIPGLIGFGLVLFGRWRLTERPDTGHFALIGGMLLVAVLGFCWQAWARAGRLKAQIDELDALRR